MKGSKGLTLIEILLVLAVLGILLGLAAPSLNAYITQLRFNEAARTLSEAVLRARDTASSTSIGVRIEADGDTVRWVDDVSNAELGRISLPNNVTLDARRTAVLSGRGLPQGQVEFPLSSAGVSGSVFLLPTGAILR